ncbi:hypothetical protein [Streptosporangium saharense]|uniref:DUF4209 domain-containing protein n=1 Tax=Streptosporangium saharense TaxID=1706840 RepID=A0A7W7VL96_9ACTN|nr:hypothetical protein [Streptosporangium saharense]MBB4914442.1 hypothetical protein [Streptosporangium saharense]
MWFLTEAPSGNHAGNEATARQIVNEIVFTRIARVTLYSTNDLPKKVISGDDEAYRNELARVEQYSMGCSGMLLVNALDLTRARFGIPAQGDLETFISQYGAHPTLAQALAQALRLYWVGEYSASVHLAAPKIEAAARALLLEINKPLYRAAVGDATGQFPGLGVFLEHLVDSGFDPDWERFLRTLLLSDGANVRNFVAHGFMHDADRNTAALVLRACAVLMLITSEDAAQRDSAAVKSALMKPLGGRPHRSWRRRVTDTIRAAYFEFRR